MGVPGGIRTVGRAGQRQVLIGLLIAALLLVPAAIAWACGPNRQMQLDLTTYGPGDTVTVTGANFYPNMELRFRLDPGSEFSTKTDQNGSFSLSFPGPTEPGGYALQAEGYLDGEPVVNTNAVGSFEVRAAPPSNPRPDPRPDPGRPDPGRPDPRPDLGPGTDSPRPDPRPSRPDGGAAITPPDSGGGGTQGAGDWPPPRSGPVRGLASRGATPNRTGGTPGARRAGNGRGERTGTGAYATVNDEGRDVFAGSVPRRDRAVASGARLASGAAKPAGPSERTASGDIWSGFGSSMNASLLPKPGDPAAPESGAESETAWGAALLALGLLVLVGCVGVAEARRRRALVR